LTFYGVTRNEPVFALAKEGRSDEAANLPHKGEIAVTAAFRQSPTFAVAEIY
jgi:hypothetical protein